GRERIIAERDEALEYLKGELALRDGELAKLKGAVEKIERERCELSEDLRRRLEEVETKLSAREEGIEYLKGEMALRDEMLRSRDEGIEFLKQQIAERDQG